MKSADERTLLALQSFEAMESNEVLGPPAVQGATLIEVIGLRRHLPPSQQALADEWIAQRIKLFADVYARAEPATFTRECPFHQAERAFAGWVKEAAGYALPTAFVDQLYVLPAAALPTLDRFALAVDRLPRDDTFRDGFVAAMNLTPDNATHLAEALARRRDPAIAEKVFTAVLVPRPSAACPTTSWAVRVELSAFVALWNATYGDLPTWNAGARALAGSAPRFGDPDLAARTLLHEAWRIWPDRRAALLYVVGHAADADRYPSFTTGAAAARFQAEIGPPATAEEVSAASALAASTHSGGPCLLTATSAAGSPPLAGQARLR
jgi:hypothetical protein